MKAQAFILALSLLNLTLLPQEVHTSAPAPIDATQHVKDHGFHYYFQLVKAKTARKAYVGVWPYGKQAESDCVGLLGPDGKPIEFNYEAGIFIQNHMMDLKGVGGVAVRDHSNDELTSAVKQYVEGKLGPNQVTHQNWVLQPEMGNRFIGGGMKPTLICWDLWTMDHLPKRRRMMEMETEEDLDLKPKFVGLTFEDAIIGVVCIFSTLAAIFIGCCFLLRTFVF